VNERLVEQAFDRQELRPETDWAGVKRRQIEEVADDAIQPLRFGERCPEQALSIRCMECEIGAFESFEAGPDRRQRRAKIVAHRPQDRGLDRVAAPQSFRLERLAGELLPVDCDREERRERVEEAAPPLEGRPAPTVHVQRGHEASAGAKPERSLTGTRASVGTELDPRRLDAEDARCPLGDTVEFVR